MSCGPLRVALPSWRSAAAALPIQLPHTLPHRAPLKPATPATEEQKGPQGGGKKTPQKILRKPTSKIENFYRGKKRKLRTEGEKNPK
jgi:hypothetical protein